MLYAEQKAYYTDVTNVLRKYISQRYNINALEMTSHEMLDSLKETCDALKIDDLRAILTTIDLVKFAKYSTNLNDMDYYLNSIEHFIDSTKINEPVEVVSELKEDIKDKRSRKMLKLTIALLIVASVVVFLYTLSEVYTLVM